MSKVFWITQHEDGTGITVGSAVIPLSNTTQGGRNRKKRITFYLIKYNDKNITESHLCQKQFSAIKNTNGLYTDLSSHNMDRLDHDFIDVVRPTSIACLPNSRRPMVFWTANRAQKATFRCPVSVNVVRKHVIFSSTVCISCEVVLWQQVV